MISLSLFARLLAAEELDLRSLVGEDWYGLYMKGQKVGYAVNMFALGDDGAATLTEEMEFRMNMGGIRQDLHLSSRRVYSPSGDLARIDSKLVALVGGSENDGTARVGPDQPRVRTESTYSAEVEGDTLVLRTNLAGQTDEARLPKPQESLRDAIHQRRFVGPNAKVGDELTFTLFEPLYRRELKGTSRIIGAEERVFDGAPTKVYKIKTVMEDLGIETVAYVGQDGTVFEDVTANLLTMRLEPKEVARDINYSNDVIVSNAALLDAPISNARQRAALTLRIEGPLTAVHLFNDDRQRLVAKDGGFEFTGKRISLDGYPPARLPITDAGVAQWVESTHLVQSNHPDIVAKAKEIVGEERDALEVARRLCAWVYENVRTTYSAQLPNALDVLRHPQGDCTEHSVLFVALARAAGLPAREAAGLFYVETPQPGFYFHQWASVWVGKWIDMDPTWNQPLADVTHIKLAEGDLFEHTKLFPLIGQIRVTVVDTPTDFAKPRDE